jgi:tRNA dimethylallyltransferase
MKIGTAAPAEAQLRQVRHFFVRELGLDEYYSASMYEQQVLALLERLFQTSDYALLAGGSMMYIDAVCNGIDDIPTVDDETRALMKRRLADEGLEALCEELRRLDPDHWAVVDRKNPRRVVHALEICHMTGRTYTSFRVKDERLKMKDDRYDYSSLTSPSGRPFRIVKIGLNRPREELYERINRRVDQMMEQGLLDEARRLLPYRHLNALNTVGYKEMFAYLDGIWSLDEAVERMKGNTRRYARKQLTWFKRDPMVRWFSPDQKEDIINYIDQQDD